MDPVSIATASYTLLTAIATVSRSLTTFTRNVRGARRDIDGFLRELRSLALCLETLRDQEFPFPSSLKATLLNVLDSCDEVVREMAAILDKHRSGGTLRQAQWSVGDGQEVIRLRQRLEAYKSALDITLELGSFTVLIGVRRDTRDILAELADLKAQVARLSAAEPGPNPMLQRFLDETATYAESLSGPDLDATSIDLHGYLTDNGPGHDAWDASLRTAVPRTVLGPPLDTDADRAERNPATLSRFDFDFDFDFNSRSSTSDLRQNRDLHGVLPNSTSRSPNTTGLKQARDPDIQPQANRWSIAGRRSDERWYLLVQEEVRGRTYETTGSGDCSKTMRVYEKKLRENGIDYRPAGRDALHITQTNDAATASVEFRVYFWAFDYSELQRFFLRNHIKKHITFTLYEGSFQDFKWVVALHLTVFAPQRGDTTS